MGKRKQSQKQNQPTSKNPTRSTFTNEEQEQLEKDAFDSVEVQFLEDEKWRERSLASNFLF